MVNLRVYKGLVPADVVVVEVAFQDDFEISELVAENLVDCNVLGKDVSEVVVFEPVELCAFLYLLVVNSNDTNLLGVIDILLKELVFIWI